LLGAGTVERPQLGVFDVAAEILFDLGLAAERLGWLIAIEPDVL
jgi:hypothetical protein